MYSLNESSSLEGLYRYLFELLDQLDGVMQSPRYHPEGDTLYHSLQVFQLAFDQSDDPELWAAALFHDVGKAVDSKKHAEIGYDALSGVFSERVCWLVLHHLDLMKQPGRTNRRFKSEPWLRDLHKLRRWDEDGRSTCAQVQSIEDALNTLFQFPNIFNTAE